MLSIIEEWTNQIGCTHHPDQCLISERVQRKVQEPADRCKGTALSSTKIIKLFTLSSLLQIHLVIPHRTNQPFTIFLSTVLSEPEKWQKISHLILA